MTCHGLGAPGGGLSEWTAVDQRMLHRVPEGIDAVRAALVEPMSVAFRGVRLGRPRPGSCAVVLGAGQIGLALTGRGGRFVTLAAYAEAVAYDPTEIMMREIEIVSSFSTCGEFSQVLAHLQAGRYPLEGWVERVPFDAQVAAYERLRQGTAMKVLIDVAPPPGSVGRANAP